MLGLVTAFGVGRLVADGNGNCPNSLPDEANGRGGVNELLSFTRHTSLGHRLRKSDIHHVITFCDFQQIQGGQLIADWSSSACLPESVGDVQGARFTDSVIPQTTPLAEPGWVHAISVEFPMVGRAGQPWAGGRNPVGIWNGIRLMGGTPMPRFGATFSLATFPRG